VSVADGTGVTVVNVESWQARSEELARLLQTTSPGGVIPDPIGAPADPDRLATVTDPGFWASEPQAIAEVLPLEAPGGRPALGGHAAGVMAVPPERLTLTVEAAAALLGISRAFAYEAVRRGEIPSIRLGRPVLVPWIALDRLVAGPAQPAPLSEEN
jgi:excisionase family DNA binding protein